MAIKYVFVKWENGRIIISFFFFKEKNSSLFVKKNKLIQLAQECFVSSLVKIGTVLMEKKIFEGRQ